MAAEPVTLGAEFDRRRALGALVGSAVGLVAWREALARRDAGPLYLACRADPHLQHHAAALGEAGGPAFDLELPGRGHGFALHPRQSVGVVFARGPGRFGLVFDYASGTGICRFDAAADRHFFGHGCFSADGRLLFTTENDAAGGRGVIGVRDAADGYRRVGELPSGGVGPHELRRLPDGHLAIANGGMRTGPDGDERVLNLADMQPSLAIVEPDSGRPAAALQLDPALRLNSIRHLDVDPAGRVALAMQYQGAADDRVPLVGLHAGGAIRLFDLPPAIGTRLRHYIGSVAFDRSGAVIAASAPKGGLVLFFEADRGVYLGAVELRDGCGVAPAPALRSFVLTSGLGHLVDVTVTDAGPAITTRRHLPGTLFDNHAIALRRPLETSGAG